MDTLLTRLAVGLIERERSRQITTEGYHAVHDDALVHGELAQAAACYAETLGMLPWPAGVGPDRRADHPRLRALAIAGALIAAEIERQLRAGALVEDGAADPALVSDLHEAQRELLRRSRGT